MKSIEQKLKQEIASLKTELDQKLNYITLIQSRNDNNINYINKRLKLLIKSSNIKEYVYNNLYGLGLEIGPGETPFLYNENDTIMEYTDVLNREQLLNSNYATQGNIKLIPNINYICNAINLKNIPDNKYDFVCSSHLFEHLCNPELSIINQLRVLKTNGHILMIFPDHKLCFDKNKPTSTLNELKDSFDKNHISTKYNHHFFYTFELFVEYINYLSKKYNFTFSHPIYIQGMHIHCLIKKG